MKGLPTHVKPSAFLKAIAPVPAYPAGATQILVGSPIVEFYKAGLGSGSVALYSRDLSRETAGWVLDEVLTPGQGYDEPLFGSALYYDPAKSLLLVSSPLEIYASEDDSSAAGGGHIHAYRWTLDGWDLMVQSP